LGLKPDENGSIFIMCGHYIKHINKNHDVSCEALFRCGMVDNHLPIYCSKGLITYEWVDVLIMGIKKLEWIKSKVEYNKYDKH